MIAALARPEVLLLLFVLLFAPLAFGTVEPWSLAIADGAALSGLALALYRRTRDGRLVLHAVPGILPLLLFLAFPLLQCLPLPPPLLRILSPAGYARWDAALGSTGPLPWLPISLDPLESVREFFRFSACGAFYILTVQLLARRARLHALALALAIFAGVLSFEAILQHLVAPLRLLFIRPAPWLYPFGPFVNRNHYANLMAMLTPVVFSLFLAKGTSGGPRTLRARLVDLLARPESGVRLLLGFAALLTAASLVISLSRGATVAVIAALLVFGGCLIAQRLGRRRSVAAALFFYAFTVFVGWFGWEKVADRFAGLRLNPEIVDTVRAGLWRDTLRLFADFPLLGAGVGSFGRIYPSCRTVPGPFAIAHAHNDYLELLAGGGAVGLGLFLWFAGAVLFAASRACGRGQDPLSLSLAFGSIAGCVAFLVHGASDFSLAIGANALYFFFLLGLAVSASHSRGHQDEAQSLLRKRMYPGVISHLAAALALVTVLGHTADLTARRAWDLAQGELQRAETPGVTPPTVTSLIARAALVQPLDSRYPSALARIAQLQGNTDKAFEFTRRALRLLSVDAGSLMRLGDLFAARGQAGSARRSFDAAVAADPAQAANREKYGAWLLSRGDRRAGLAQLREAMALEPERAPGIFGMLVLSGYSDEQIAVVVPLNPAVLLKFARYAKTTGARRLAGETYGRVLAIEPGNKEAQAGLRTSNNSR